MNLHFTTLGAVCSACGRGVAAGQFCFQRSFPIGSTPPFEGPESLHAGKPIFKIFLCADCFDLVDVRLAA